MTLTMNTEGLRDLEWNYVFYFFGLCEEAGLLLFFCVWLLSLLFFKLFKIFDFGTELLIESIQLLNYLIYVLCSHLLIQVLCGGHGLGGGGHVPRICTHCGQDNHNVDWCWDLHGRSTVHQNAVIPEIDVVTISANEYHYFLAAQFFVAASLTPIIYILLFSYHLSYMLLSFLLIFYLLVNILGL